MRRAAHTLLLVTALTLRAPAAQGALLLDQQQTSDAGCPPCYVGVSDVQTTAETFTAGITGPLLRVSIRVSRRDGRDDRYNLVMPGDLIVELQSTVVATTKVFGGSSLTEARVPSGTALASATVPVGTVPASPSTWIDVDFMSPASVTAGERYAIVLSMVDVPGDTTLRASHGWATGRGPSGADLYPGGDQLAKSATATLWSLFTRTGFLYDDLLFKTWVFDGPVATTSVSFGRLKSLYR
jgi:hypothetical protein